MRIHLISRNVIVYSWQCCPTHHICELNGNMPWNAEKQLAKWGDILFLNDNELG